MLIPEEDGNLKLLRRGKVAVFGLHLKSWDGRGRDTRHKDLEESGPGGEGGKSSAEDRKTDKDVQDDRMCPN